METSNDSFEAVASAYIRSRRPHASCDEVGNTVARLREAIRGEELDLVEVMNRVGAHLGPNAAHRPLEFGDVARACRDQDRGRLTARERVFVEQMCAMGFRGRPSRRQTDWLEAIFARLQRRAV